MRLTGERAERWARSWQVEKRARMRVCQVLGISPVVAGVRGPVPYRHRRRWRGRPRR